jgi:hypothetical protein
MTKREPTELEIIKGRLKRGQVAFEDGKAAMLPPQVVSELLGAGYVLAADGDQTWFYQGSTPLSRRRPGGGPLDASYIPW